MSTARTSTPRSHPVRTGTRAGYRHGDLRRALLDAGLAMAEEGGPDAVVLREATRRAGVTPNAAYRHFADRQALLEAVSAAAQGQVADAMEAAIAGVGGEDAASAARAGLRAVGAAYLGFAREHPGLFRVAFGVPGDLNASDDPAKAGRRGRTPFRILADALDALAAAGVLPVQRRENAEFLAWSAVHGLGMLLIDGPLRALGERGADLAGERLLDFVDRGL